MKIYKFKENAKLWMDLGFNVRLLKVEKLIGTRKLYRSSISITENNLNDGSIYNEYNFLAIQIKYGNLLCLDIDNVDNTIENFHKLLDANGFTLDDFDYDITLHDGYHIYFKNSMEVPRNFYGKVRKGIHYDILCKGNLFMPPSYFGEMEYKSTGKMSVINDIEDLMDVPEFLIEYIMDMEIN